MKPKPVADIELSFPTNVDRLMPTNEPDWAEYRNMYGNHESSWGFKFFSAWFYSGLSRLELVPKPGIDEKLALRHIMAVMRSFEPKHEDKTAAVAWMIEHWFEESGSVWEADKNG